MVLTLAHIDNRSKRYIFASASICLVLAVVGLICGFFETLRPAGDPDNSLCPSKEASKMLIEDEDDSGAEISL